MENVFLFILLSHGYGHRETGSNVCEHTLHTNKMATKIP